MTAKKSQEESEQPAKVYQLDAIESQVKDVAEQMKTGFHRVNTSIDTLLIKSESQVTPQQFAENLLAQKKILEDRLTEEIEKVHLEYRPLKKTINVLFAICVTAAVGIFGQVVFILNLTKGG